MLTIPKILAAAADRFGDEEALCFPGQRWSFAELADKADAYARGTAALGIGRGDHVGILMPDTADYAAVLLGLWSIGAVAVPVNGRYKHDELAYIIGHSDMRLLIVDDDEENSPGFRKLLATLPEMVEEARSLEFPLLEHVVGLDPSSLGGARELRGLVSSQSARQPVGAVSPDDDAVLLYTSGTTSRPKGCLQTHGALARHAGNALGNALTVTAGDRVFTPLPLFHAGGVVMLIGCMALGATMVHSGRFDAGTAIAVMEQERCTVGYAPFEAMWGAIVSHPALASADLSRLRVAVYCAPSGRVIQAQEAMRGTIMVSAYGSTESCTNLTMGRPDDPLEKRMFTVGPVVDGMELKIVDSESRAELPTGARGELMFRGYARLKGYYKDPAVTHELIDEDGWFSSGDLASVDEDGHLLFHGRLRDLLKVGGENVASIEIESYLARHPAIEVVQVVGVSDSHYGEVPAAFIQLKEGATLTLETVQDFCADKIASFKIPRYVRLVDGWPMSGTKIKKFVLRAELMEELQRAGITRAPKLNRRPAAPPSDSAWLPTGFRA